jgi:hypothetical protein
MTIPSCPRCGEKGRIYVSIENGKMLFVGCEACGERGAGMVVAISEPTPARNAAECIDRLRLRVEVLERELAEAREANRWIDASVQKPENIAGGGVMLLFVRWPTGGLCYGFYWHDRDLWIDGLTGQAGPCWIWRPLPQPPESETP